LFFEAISIVACADIHVRLIRMCMRIELRSIAELYAYGNRIRLRRVVAPAHVTLCWVIVAGAK
jgi:hypothetical protein